MKLLITFIIALNSTVYASGYYGRFWRGEAKKDYSELRNYCDDRYSDCFIELLNRWLIPATPSYAATDALMAYAPVVLPKELKEKYHDEVALILYRSESDYYRLRNDNTNVEGSTYGPIHGDIFEMGEEGRESSSRSLIPKEYKTLITINENDRTGLKEVSFDILNTKEELYKTTGFFQLVERKESTKIEKFLKRVNVHMSAINRTKNIYKIKGAYSLVTEDYAMFYLFIDKKKAVKFEKSILYNNYSLNDIWSTKLKELNPIQRSPLLYNRIGYGEGGNLIFTPGVKPGKADHYRMHKK